MEKSLAREMRAQFEKEYKEDLRIVRDEILSEGGNSRDVESIFAGERKQFEINFKKQIYG